MKERIKEIENIQMEEKERNNAVCSSIVFKHFEH